MAPPAPENPVTGVPSETGAAVVTSTSKIHYSDGHAVLTEKCQLCDAVVPAGQRAGYTSKSGERVHFAGPVCRSAACARAIERLVRQTDLRL